MKKKIFFKIVWFIFYQLKVKKINFFYKFWEKIKVFFINFEKKLKSKEKKVKKS
jgi:hypothetical protein